MNKSILIIEDDIPTLTMLVDAFRDEGYIIYTAVTFEQAFLHLFHVSIDLVMCDSLTTLLAERYNTLNQVKSVTNSPIIIMTAHNPELYKDYKELGFAGVLFKPFDLDQLFEVVSAFVNDN